MAYKEVKQSDAIDIKSEKFINKPIEGHYTGSREITTQLGKNTIYEFVSPNTGKDFGIFGFTFLNMRMSSVHEGDLVRITYLGTKKMDTKYKKNQDVHQVKVEVDTDENLYGSARPAPSREEAPAKSSGKSKKVEPEDDDLPF